MKRATSKLVLLPLLSILMTGCVSKPSSYNSLDYSSADVSGPGGYVFDMEDKYALNPAIKDTIETFGEIFDIETELDDLLEVIHVNDFYANKVTITTVEQNLFDYGDNGNTFDEGNYIITTTKTLTRNNTNHTVSGTGVYNSKDHLEEYTSNGTYSITYGEGNYEATTTWNYDRDELDSTQTHLLNDEFVNNNLAFCDAKTFIESMIESSLDDSSIFDVKNIVGVINNDGTGITLNRSTLVENYRHDQIYRMYINPEGFVETLSYSYCHYYGKTTAAPILRESGYTMTFEKVN